MSEAEPSVPEEKTEERLIPLGELHDMTNLARMPHFQKLMAKEVEVKDGLL